MAKMLIVSPEFYCSHEILTIVAMLSGRYRGFRVLILYADGPGYYQCLMSGSDHQTSGRRRMLRRRS